MKRPRTSCSVGQDLEDLCAGAKIPVFRDCISYLTKTRHGERAAFCVPGLFETAVTDRKVQLLRQAYHLGRNPLRMLSLQDPRSVAGLLKSWLQDLHEPLIRADLYKEILQTQQHEQTSDRLSALQAVLRENDLYRLKILVPLLELLHHHTINQDHIQHTAAMLGEVFGPCLLRSHGSTSKQTQQDERAIAAATAMVLEYRSLFLHTMLDAELQISPQPLTSRSLSIPKQRPTSMYAASSYPMPIPPRSASVQRHHCNIEPEDGVKGGSGSNLISSISWPNSPKSDDLDSAFSGSSLSSMYSHDTEELRRHFQGEEIDNDLAAAVDSLFCASTTDLLIPI